MYNACKLYSIKKKELKEREREKALAHIAAHLLFVFVCMFEWKVYTVFVLNFIFICFFLDFLKYNSSPFLKPKYIYFQKIKSNITVHKNTQNICLRIKKIIKNNKARTSFFVNLFIHKFSNSFVSFVYIFIQIYPVFCRLFLIGILYSTHTYTYKFIYLFLYNIIISTIHLIMKFHYKTYIKSSLHSYTVLIRFLIQIYKFMYSI